MSTHHIEIFPSNDAGFVCGLPGIPSNTKTGNGARIEGEVHITLPFLGVPASAVEIELQKSESIQLDGQDATVTEEKLDEMVLWTGSKSSNMYSRRFRFSIEIPENLPPTVILDKPGLQIHIQYLLRATVYRENRIKFWSDKPITCTVPVTITKYEHHPAWPIYHHPKPKHTSNGSMTFTARPMRICYSPGETIRIVSELSFGSYRVIPRKIDFEARLLQLVTTTESPKPSHRDGSFKKQPTSVLMSRDVISSPRLDHAMTFKAELRCHIPIKDVNPTLIYRSRIQVSHVLAVTVVIHAEHLQIDIPVIISPFTSESLIVNSEDVGDPGLLLKNIGDVPSLGGTLDLEYLSQDLQLQTHRTASKHVPESTSTEFEEDNDAPHFPSNTNMSHTIVSDDRATPTDFYSSSTLSSESDRSNNRHLVRKSGARSASLNSESDVDQLTGLNQGISADWFTKSGGSLMWRLFGGTSESSSVNFIELFGDLTVILLSREKTEALLELRGDQAKVVIDFLNSILVALDPCKTQVRKQIFITLYRLCEASKCHPTYDTLSNISVGQREGGGGLCDIHRGRHRDQVLCLKVIRTDRKRNSEVMLKLFAKEAIVWSQLDHPNILPFYGIYYLGREKRMCLVSPWLENGNLVNYLQENPTVSRRPFILDVATGLKYLHDKDIIHGDLKSTNVLITSFGRACITDFGLALARAASEASTVESADEQLGRIHRWSAPELLDGSNSRPSQASDIWAFGCLCYQILTRCVPFYEIHSETTVASIVLKGEIPSKTQMGDPASVTDVIDDKMWSLLKHCWSFKPGERPTCRYITSFLKIRESVEHRSTLAYGQTAEFRSAMRENFHFPIDLNDILRLFDEIKRIEEEPMKLR